jgi:hypothetical protein
LAQDATQYRDPAADLFRHSRAAVGGGAVTKIKAVSREDGRTRRRARWMRTHDRVDSEIRAAIKILLPDHDRRVDTAATSERVSGYAGKRGIARLGERLIGGDL